MTRLETLEKAKACVCGQRKDDYGTPEDNFGVIADLWGCYLGCGVKAEDVAIMMILLKIARLCTRRTKHGTADSWIDVAGYAACGCEISTQKEKP